MAFDDKLSKQELARGQANLLKVLKQDPVSILTKNLPKNSQSEKR